MKKTVLMIALAATLFSSPIHAQYTKDDFQRYHEADVTYGFVTVPQFVLIFATAFGTAFTGGLWKVDNIFTTGSIGGEYYYNLNPHVGLGGIGTFEMFGGDAMSKNTSTGEYEYSGDFHGTFISVMPAAKLGWFSRQHFQMYSKLAAGAMFYDTAANEPLSKKFTFAAQVSPICLSAGGGHLWGKLELGFGMQGLIAGGLCWRF